ncbi:MAG: biosynthetic arginine decarboxylase [Acidobacteriota bacterium]
MKPKHADRWSIAEAISLYGIDAWGQGFFSVNERGNLQVGPTIGPARTLDLKELVDEVKERGIAAPLLIRFSDLLEARILEIHAAFRRAIEEHEYEGDYLGVYPIKVNQDRYMVHDLVEYGRRFHFGLEAGSKPELLAVIAVLSDPEALIICNGYKDEEYIETALLASRLGPKVVLVVEKLSELPLIVAAARRMGIRPRIGVRMRLATKGAGHWESSGGDRSKFGLTARGLLEATDYLRQEEMLDTFELLHFHLGSQIASIRNLKTALREGGQFYVNLVRMGVPLKYFDVGGGLGVDYDGSQAAKDSSINYSLQEYANDVVFGIKEVCDPAGVEPPILVTEAGRATVAHHAVLVFEIIGVGEPMLGAVPDELPPDTEPVLSHMLESYRALTGDNVRETYHDVQEYREECLSLFRLGHLPLEHRVMAEDIYGAVCLRARQLARGMAHPSPELEDVEPALADTYFGNFSIFQSMPDSWAIGQLFPVVPIHRLDEKPSSFGVIADMTCDSDGKIDRFINPDPASRDERPVLDLHELRDEPYYLAVCLVGAYQEILGDLHNLFGDTNTVHVSLDEEDGYRIDHVIEGDTVMDVLGQVGYRRDGLLARVRRWSEMSIRRRRMSREQARQLLRAYEDGLAGYTYLERD